jgi:hypothetical protein
MSISPPLLQIQNVSFSRGVWCFYGWGHDPFSTWHSSFHGGNNKLTCPIPSSVLLFCIVPPEQSGRRRLLANQTVKGYVLSADKTKERVDRKCQSRLLANQTVSKNTKDELPSWAGISVHCHIGTFLHLGAEELYTEHKNRNSSPVQERCAKRRVPLSYPPPYSHTQSPCPQQAWYAPPTLSWNSIKITLIVYWTGLNAQYAETGSASCTACTHIYIYWPVRTTVHVTRSVGFLISPAAATNDAFPLAQDVASLDHSCCRGIVSVCENFPHWRRLNCTKKFLHQTWTGTRE